MVSVPQNTANDCREALALAVLDKRRELIDQGTQRLRQL